MSDSLRCRCCQKCGICVVGLDHHCPYVCNCVGPGNRRLFVVFTASASFGCALFVVLSLWKQFTAYCVPDTEGWVSCCCDPCM